MINQFTSDIGIRRIKDKALAFSIGQMVLNIKDIGKTTWQMIKED